MSRAQWRFSGRFSKIQEALGNREWSKIFPTVGVAEARSMSNYGTASSHTYFV
jgi:hypothetical protein